LEEEEEEQQEEEEEEVIIQPEAASPIVKIGKKNGKNRRISGCDR